MVQLPWTPDAEATQDGLCRLVEAMPPVKGESGWARFQVMRSTDATSLVHSLCASKPMTARVFERGQLRSADGAPLSRGASLDAGSEVTLSLAVTRKALPASDSTVTVLYQDPFVLAVDKPSGILVHGDGSQSETLSSRVQGLLTRQGFDAVPQALHRLDVETSGIVLFSLAEEFQPAFDALISGDGLRKRYYALVEGVISRPSEEGWLVIDKPIARDRHDARRMRVGSTGKPSRTRIRTIATFGSRSLVEAELETGRRHQIRVHLASSGHPIVGDRLYGGSASDAGLMLHAHEVSLMHPLTNKVLVITSEIPSAWRLPAGR